jgi:thioester reductase-like protein
MVKAFLVGATGEVGKCVFSELMSSPRYDKVVILVRRSIDYDGPRKEILVRQSHRNG